MFLVFFKSLQTFITAVVESVSINSIIPVFWAYFYWWTFLPVMGDNFLFLCLSSKFLLNAGHYKFYMTEDLSSFKESESFVLSGI